MKLKFMGKKLSSRCTVINHTNRQRLCFSAVSIFVDASKKCARRSIKINPHELHCGGAVLHIYFGKASVVTDGVGARSHKSEWINLTTAQAIYGKIILETKIIGSGIFRSLKQQKNQHSH